MYNTRCYNDFLRRVNERIKYIIKCNYNHIIVTVLLVYCKMIDSEQLQIVAADSARISIQRSNNKVTMVNTKHFEMSKTSR